MHGLFLCPGECHTTLITHNRGPKAKLHISHRLRVLLRNIWIETIRMKYRMSYEILLQGSASGHARRLKDDDNVINLESVEQLRLRLRQACTTFKGVKPNKVFDRWDKNGDGSISREEMWQGMEKLGSDVLSEWKMFDNFLHMLTEIQVGSLIDPTLVALSWQNQESK